MRNALADRFSETATTEDGRYLVFDRVRWQWVDADTRKPVAVRITWIDLD